MNATNILTILPKLSTGKDVLMVGSKLKIRSAAYGGMNFQSESCLAVAYSIPFQSLVA